MVSWVEFNALTTPTPATSPAAIVTTSGPIYFDRVSATTGHTIDKGGASTLVTSLYGLTVQRCKPVAVIMQAAVLAGPGAQGDALVDRALLEIGAVLSYRNAMTIAGVNYTGPDGSFPAHMFGTTKDVFKFHNKLIALDRIGYALLLFRDSAFNVGARAATYATLLGQFTTCARWAATPDIDQYQRYFRNENTANRTMRACCFFEKAGLLLGDQGMRDLSENLAKCVLGVAQDSPEVDIPPLLVNAIMQEEADRNGTGFDIHYNNLSQELLSDLYMTVPDGQWRETLLATMALCETSWLGHVNLATGLLNPIGSSRSKEVFPRKPGSTYFGDNDNTWRIHLMHYLLGDGVVPPDLADKVISVGQTFTHAGPDGDDEGDAEPLVMIVMDAADVAEVAGVSATTPWRALRPVERIGGGACAAYPGGTIPNPVFILPQSAAYAAPHAAHWDYLRTLPTLDVSENGFPPQP